MELEALASFLLLPPAKYLPALGKYFWLIKSFCLISAIDLLACLTKLLAPL